MGPSFDFLGGAVADGVWVLWDVVIVFGPL
jgi:hypothetical protein